LKNENITTAAFTVNWVGS